MPEHGCEAERSCSLATAKSQHSGTCSFGLNSGFLVPPLTSCVSLGQLIKRLCTCLGVLERLNESQHKKCLELCLI